MKVPVPPIRYVLVMLLAVSGCYGSVGAQNNLTQTLNGVNILSVRNASQLPALEQARKLGAKTVVLVSLIHQSDTRSTDMRIDPQITLGKQYTQEFIEKAHQYRMRVIYKPLLKIDNGRYRGEFIGDRQKWFDSYKRVLNTLFSWSRGADGVVIGTELDHLENDSSWSQIVQLARNAQFPFVSYDTNWGMANSNSNPAWFQSLDAVGISAFYPLLVGDNATTDQLVSSWQSIAGKILAYSRLVGKPIWFAEVGITDYVGTYRTPWADRPTTVNVESQRRYYEATIKVWGNKVPMTWWTLTNKPEDNGHYSPMAKPAERVLSVFLHQSSE